MHSQENDNITMCPHCGFKITKPPEMWLSYLNEVETDICPNCQMALGDRQTNLSASNVKIENRKFKMRFWIITILLMSLLIFLNRTFDILSFKEDAGQIIYETLFILIISSAIAAGKMWKNIRYLVVWVGIFFILIIGYSFRYELSEVKERIFAEMMPARGFQKQPDTISFPVSSDGHFYIRAEVNGIPLIFLADSGASHIVLSPDDAVKLGIKTNELKFDRLYETANGMGRGSSIRIDDFRIGEIHFKHIGASVNEVKMQNSLLGMTFFRRLKSYAVKDDVLTLHWNR